MTKVGPNGWVLELLQIEAEASAACKIIEAYHWGRLASEAMEHRAIEGATDEELEDFLNNQRKPGT